MTPFSYVAHQFDFQNSKVEEMWSEYTSTAMHNSCGNVASIIAGALRRERNRMRTEQIGRWFQLHFGRRVVESGAFTAAKQLRKQGVPLEIALLLLVR